MITQSANNSLQATAAAPFVFDGVGDLLLSGSLVTQFQAFLRRYSIDRLPDLRNIACGRLSLQEWMTRHE
jgi:lipopolysaccharide/colanic/teichoic acid biosynthesis glycosyltransferase